MIIQTLQTVPTAVLTQTFNSAFSDYLLPFHLTESDLNTKIAAENIRLENSAGAFEKGKLVGFMLIGSGASNAETFAYNAGTGVIPECRGQQLTQKMYAFLLPHLAKRQITKHRLEVLSKNEKAIRVYKKVGFKTKRLLTCLQGIVSKPKNEIPYEIRNIAFPLNPEKFFNHEPAFQNSADCIERTLHDHIILGAFAEDRLVGFIAFSEAGRVKPFGVDPDFRKKGIGHALFYEARQKIKGKNVSLINVDDSDKETIEFLGKIALETTVQQYEMTMEFI